MVGVAHDRDGDAGLGRPIDAVVHGDPPGVVAPAVAGVEEGDRATAPHPGRPRRRLQDSRRDERHVAGQPRRAVRSDAAQVGRHEHLGDVGGDLGRGADPLEQVGRPAAKWFGLHDDGVDRLQVGHGGRVADRPTR